MWCLANTVIAEYRRRAHGIEARNYCQNNIAVIVNIGAPGSLQKNPQNAEPEGRSGDFAVSVGVWRWQDRAKPGLAVLPGAGLLKLVILQI